MGHARLGQTLVYSGRAAEAVPVIKRGLRHNPYDPQIASHLTILALAHFHSGQYEEAARQGHAAMLHNDLRAAGIEAASLARLGRVEEARRKFTPDVQMRAAKTVRRIIPYARPEDFFDLLDALRLAGLGEPILADLGSASAKA
jgi:Flp pilus assembly protein TadD